MNIIVFRDLLVLLGTKLSSFVGYFGNHFGTTGVEHQRSRPLLSGNCARCASSWYCSALWWPYQLFCSLAYASATACSIIL